MRPYSWSSISVNLGFTSYCTIDRKNENLERQYCVADDNEIDDLYY